MRITTRASRRSGRTMNSFHPAAGDQKLCPGLIVKAADLDDRMSVGSVLNELAIADEHSRMINVPWGGTEEEQVARLEIFAVYGDHAAPRGLFVCVARHIEAAGTHQHLRETGAVEAKARPASP